MLVYVRRQGTGWRKFHLHGSRGHFPRRWPRFFEPRRRKQCGRWRVGLGRRFRRDAYSDLGRGARRLWRRLDGLHHYFYLNRLLFGWCMLTQAEQQPDEEQRVQRCGRGERPPGGVVAL